jgi:hypothetical protein
VLPTQASELNTDRLRRRRTKGTDRKWPLARLYSVLLN